MDQQFNSDSLNTSMLLRQISHSDSLNSVGSNTSANSRSTNKENKINNNIINDFESSNNNNNNNNNNNATGQNPILSPEQKQQLEQYYQQFESDYKPPHVYIFDPDLNEENIQSNNNNNQRSQLVESRDLSTTNNPTTPLMIPENIEDNKRLKEEIMNELIKNESFKKIQEPGEIYGFCECTLLYNHLTISNLVITSNNLIFLPQQQVDKDYVLESYLHKKGDFFWKKYWFVLTPDSISWYKNSILKETHYPNGTILLSKIVTVDKLDPEETGKPFCLQIMTNTQIHLIQLDTEPQLEHWYDEINKMQKNLNVTIPLNDIVSISMESNAALFFDSLCLTLKKGENCLVTPTSSSNEIYNLLIKLWNRKRGITITEPEKQQRLLEFQKTFKLSQNVVILVETQCTFYQDEEFSYEGILYASTDSLYFSSSDSVLIIPESDIYAITIDRKSDNRDALKVYTTDFDVIYFDQIEDIETFFNIISGCYSKSNPKIFFSTVGQIPPIQEPKDHTTSSKSTYQSISSGIRSWKIPMPSLPNFSIPIPKSLPYFKSKSSSNSSYSNPNKNEIINYNDNNQVVTHTPYPNPPSTLALPSTSPPQISPPQTSVQQQQQQHEKTVIIQKNSSINSDFHDIFPLLPLDETVIMFQNCTLYYYSYDSNVEGTVYITKSYIAFNPSPLPNQQQQQQSSSSITKDYLDTDSDTDSEGDLDYDINNHDNSVVVVNNNNYKVKEVLMKKALIPFEDIVSITKERFALFFNQCVKIVTYDHKWIFGSLNNFIGFYSLVIDTWKSIPKQYLSNSTGIDNGTTKEGSTFTPLESIKIKNKLGLPVGEVLITWFNCTNFKGAQLKYGYLYISNNNVCFRSKFGFQKRNIVIPLNQVIEIKKYSGFIPNGIKITTASHHEFQFASFIHRNRVYQILYETWLKANSKLSTSTPVSPTQSYNNDIQEIIEDEIIKEKEFEESGSSSSSSSGLEKIRKTIKSLPILASQKIHHETQQNLQQQQQQQQQQPRSGLTSPRSGLTSPRSGLTSPRSIPPLTITQSPGFSSLVNSPNLPIKPLKITILTIGSRGDIQPFIALSLGLKEYGHTVTLCSHELYRDLITKEFGLNYQPLGGDPKELMDLCVRNGIFTPKFIVEALSRFRSFIDDLLLTCWKASQGAEVLIATPGCFAGPHIAETLQIPFFKAFTMPFTRTRTYPNPFAPFASRQMGGVFNLASHVMMEKVLWQPISAQINQWRTDTLKIPPWNSSVSINETYTIPFLYCFSKYLVPKPPDWSGEISITGYWLLKNSSSSDSPPDSLIEFLNSSNSPDDIPIYIGFGSIVIDDPTALSQLLVEAIKLSGKRAIISQGWGGLSITETTKSDGDGTNSDFDESRIYLLTKPVDHTWLFEKVSLVVSHGGAGTVAATLMASKPTIIVPFFGDQFFWGERIKQTGVGTSIPFETLTAKSLSSHIVSLINEPSVRAKVSKISHLLKKEEGVSNAIDFIHRYLPVSYIPPIEIPFSSAPNSCMNCHEPFTLLHVMKPRMHCHCCGRIFCQNCTSHKIPIKKYRINTPNRVCDKCYNDLLNSNSNSFLLND